MNTFNEKFPGNSQYTSTTPTTGGFWANLELIRPIAWIIALIVFFGMECVFWVVNTQGKMDEAPLIARMALFLVPIIPTVYVLLVGYVHVDAKRRGMRYVMWTLLAIFINNFIGIILYFLMRDPLPMPCPKCGTNVRSGFAFCPNCGTELLRACRVCHKKIELGWTNCAYCGSPIASQIQKQPSS